MFKYADPSSHTQQQRDRALDKCKSTVFLADDAAFFGSLMCSLEFIWDDSMPSAATDGIRLWFNPHFFMALNEATRSTVLKHELWHVARMHSLRVGNRAPVTWNWACDIRINNDLDKTGKNSFTGIEDCWKDHSYDQQGSSLMSEEEIYEILVNNQMPPPKGGSFGVGIDGDGDLKPLNQKEKQQVINTVVQAVQQAKMSGAAGTIPGGVEKILKQFLEPVIPWEQVLMQFFSDMLEDDYTWARPNRRYEHMYLPSHFLDDGRLEHLVYFLDVSGSISMRDILRFNSEIKYIQERLNPQKLTLIQFDTEIQKIDEFEADQPFNEITVNAGGGTCLVPVREMIEKLKPTAAVIFTDLYVTPMEHLTVDIPVIWCVYNNPRATVPFGKMLHIKD